MRTASALFVLLLASPAMGYELPAEVKRAIEEAVAIPGARVVPLSYNPSLPRNCVVTRASVPRAVDGSGRIPVKLAGEGCTGSAWVRIQVWAPASVTTRAVREGEPLAGAFSTREKLIGVGRMPAAVQPDAVAARALAPGQMIEATHVQAGAVPEAGGRVKVVVRSGALEIEVDGRSVACGRARACAVLPSGKHVEGRIVDGQLLVEAP